MSKFKYWGYVIFGLVTIWLGSSTQSGSAKYRLFTAAGCAGLYAVLLVSRGIKS